MAYLFALIGILAIGFLLWRAFGPQVESEYSEHPGTTHRSPVGPDDDPEFLKDLDRRARGTNGSDSDDA